MALSAELINLKSAGTYRFERDLSTISNDTTTYSNLRLVVGFSKTGPFNTVNLVLNQREFIKLYGNIDRSLEKKGSYFHRSALVALSAGPILCLNLMNLDPDKDKVQQQSFSVSMVNKNHNKVTLPLNTLYNIDKFWTPSDVAYLNSIDAYLGGKTGETISSSTENWSDNILNITNIGRKPLSILIKKASEQSSKGYELTLGEWYGEGNVPSYLNSTSFVSDYLVEVYVVSGDFGPATKKSTNATIPVDIDDDGNDESFDVYTNMDELSTEGATTEDAILIENPYNRFVSDVVYQDYFDKDGFKRRDSFSETMDSRLNKFLNLPSVNVVAKYVGSLIPDFTDKMGRNIFIQKLINDDIDIVGLLCSVNVENIENVEVNDYFINEKIDLIGHNLYDAIVKGGRDNENYVIPELKYNFLSYKVNYEEALQIIKIKNNGTEEYVRHSVADKEFDEGLGTDNAYKFAWAEITTNDDGKKTINNGKIVYTKSSVITKSAEKCVTGGDSSIKEYTIEDFTKINSLFNELSRLKATTDKYYTSKNPSDETLWTERDNEVLLSRDANVVVGDYIVSSRFEGYESSNENCTQKMESTSRLTRVIRLTSIYNGDGKKIGIRVICADKIWKKHGVNDDMVVKFTPIDKLTERLQWICLPGFQVRNDIVPNGTNERQNEILDMLREEPEFDTTKSNLFNTLIDRDYVQWRYLVDTFGNGIEEDSKDVYTKLCKKRKSALAIINCPSQSDFKKSITPSFTNKMGGVNVEYIASGGDQSKAPSERYTLPTEDKGASFGAYYYPFLKISDLSAIKTVPPAAYVSNLYIQKYNRGDAWSIVAGQRRGVISGNQVVGVETTLIHENRDYLEPMGINSIIWENGIGVEVYANKTAKQTPVSALSSIHVREVCIYIQDNIETILRRYIFEYNTAQTRLEIKTLVDDFLETVKSNNGIYDYKTIMDISNNTTELIDNNMGVIDVYIEPVRGLEILAQQLTIMKTGGIVAGVFE